MASFRDDEAGNALDWAILRDGGIALYRNREWLDGDLQLLSVRGYIVHRFECSDWTSEEIMHTSLAAALEFPHYYGKNLNALDECLAELNVPNEGGMAVVLESYDRFLDGAGGVTPGRRELATTVLDILASASRFYLLTGRRFIILVQSDDPRLHFEGLGCVATHWNWREWTQKNRGL